MAARFEFEMLWLQYCQNGKLPDQNITQLVLDGVKYVLDEVVREKTSEIMDFSESWQSQFDFLQVEKDKVLLNLDRLSADNPKIKTIMENVFTFLKMCKYKNIIEESFNREFEFMESEDFQSPKRYRTEQVSDENGRLEQ